MTETLRGEKFRDTYLARIPLARWSDPHEAAKPICFLLSDAASYITGQRISANRSEEHTSELPSLMRISYAVFCLKKKKKTQYTYYHTSYLYKTLSSTQHTHDDLHT